MRRINKLLKKSILVASTGTLFAPILGVSLVSCQKDVIEPIESISLSAEQDYIFNGDNLQINKTITPASAQNSKIVWEIISPMEHVSISQTGVLHVDQEFSINQPTLIEIKAQDPTQEGVFDIIPIAIAKKTASNLIGFLNGTVSYWDRYLKQKEVKIVRKSLTEFETEQTIDLFATDRTGRDISFIPIFRSRVNRLMKFHIVGIDESSEHGLTWEGYKDNTWTDTIPIASASMAFLQKNVIEVRFACDIQIVFRINCFVWNRRGASSNAHASYTKKLSGDIHDITYLGEPGKYAIYMYHWNPDTRDNRDILGTINFFKPLYEYLDLKFEIDFEKLQVDYDVKGAIYSQAYHVLDNLKKIQRSEYDQFPMYQLQNILLDFSSGAFDPDRFGWDPTPLFSIVGRDPIQKGDNVSITLDFYIDWND